MNELDGEVTEVEVVSKVPNSFPYDKDRYFDQDNFYPMNGEVVPMVAASAAQNTGNYFDQDNFYPADGALNPDAVNYETEGSMSDVEFSNGIGDWFKDTVDKAKQRAAERRKARKERRAAKTEETRSRAELNRSLSQDKPSDVALAQTLKSITGQTPIGSTSGSTGMSKTTKTVLIVGGSLAVIGLVAFLVLRKKK